MNLSAKTEYACLAVLELARHFETGELVRVRTIADAYGIPSPFLVQILLQLKSAGLVASTRGASGGYRLVRSPSQISLEELVTIIEGGASEMRSNAGKPGVASRVLLEAWSAADAAQRESLREITFADLVERVHGHQDKMYYI